MVSVMGASLPSSFFVVPGSSCTIGSTPDQINWRSFHTEKPLYWLAGFSFTSRRPGSCLFISHLHLSTLSICAFEPSHVTTRIVFRDFCTFRRHSYGL